MRLLAAMLCSASLMCAVPVYADDDPPIPPAWLGSKISVSEAETAHPGITDDRLTRFPDAAKPFGFDHAKWEALKAQMKAGDEIWTFSSPPESWENLAGRAGIALVRHGKPIVVLITDMN